MLAKPPSTRGVGLSVLDRTEGFAHSVGTRRTCRDHRQAGALGVETDGDVAGSYVADEHGDEVGGDAGHALLDHRLGLLDKGLHASDARSDIYAEAVWSYVGTGFQPAVSDRLDGGAGGEAAEKVASPHASGIHAERDRVEILHPSGHMYGEFSILVHAFDQADAATAFGQSCLECIYIVSDGRDDTHAGYDYSSFFHVNGFCVCKDSVKRLFLHRKLKSHVEKVLPPDNEALGMGDGREYPEGGQMHPPGRSAYLDPGFRSRISVL